MPSTTAVIATPYPIPQNSTAPLPTGTAAPSGTGAGAGPTPAPFTGGAARVVCGGLLAGMAGAVALIL